MKRLLLVVVGATVFMSCEMADEAGYEEPYDLAYVELFDTDVTEWFGGIADYPDSLEGKLDFQISQTSITSGYFSSDNNVLRVSAKNPHADLFYYIARKFDGLQANATYQISFTYELLVEAVDTSVEDFTSDLYLKAGGVMNKPDVTVDQNYYGPGVDNIALNFDKGEGTIDGTSTIYYISHINRSIGPDHPILVQGETENEIIIQTNSNGEFWGVFGIDSKNDKELAFSFNTVIVFFRWIG